MRWILSRTEGSKIPGPQEAGKWINPGVNLDDLASDIVSGKLGPSLDALTAVPTIWARPLLFGEALINKDHPLHDDCKREFFGLLGILCFAGRLTHLRITRHNYSLDVVPGEHEKILHNSIKALKPQWKTISLIAVNEKLIGGASPYSLLFTPLDYDCHDIPWQKEGRLENPESYYEKEARNADMVEAFKRWRYQLAKQLQSPLIQERYLAGLVELLQKDGINKPIETTPIDAFADISYARVITAVKFERVTGDLFITKKGGKKEIAVIKDKWTHNVEIMNGAYTNNISFPDGERGTELNGLPSSWINPAKAFFTSKMLKTPLNQDTNLITFAEGYVPPLKKEILDYLEPFEIKDRVSFEGRTVRLRLTLSGGDTVISKTYDTDDVISIGKPPLVELWPNFVAKEWRIYYLGVRNLEPKLQIRPPDTDIKDSRHDMDAGEIIVQLGNAPEYLECTYAGQPAGIIFPKFEEVKKEGNEWQIGVDFGTSNTIVSKLVANNISILELPNRCLRIVDRAPDDPGDFVRTAFLDYKFLPRESLKQFPSTFISFKNSSQAIMDGIIFARREMGDVDLTLQIQGDLKWITEESDRNRYVVTFLKQLLLMISAEARSSGATKITMSWAYPSAFDEYMTESLAKTWDKVSVQMKENTGLHSIRILNRLTESVAICKFLADMDVAAPGGQWPQVIMDIGGGTTDIAVWSDGAMKAQTSVKLAGGVLSDFARNNRKFWETFMLVLDPRSKASNDVIESYMSRPSISLNNLFHILWTKDAEINWVAQSTNNQITKARTFIFLAFAALFYYAGMLQRHLASQKELGGCDIFLAGNGAKLYDLVNDVNFKGLEKAFQEGLGKKLSTIRIYAPQNPKEEVVRGLLAARLNIDASQALTVLAGENGYRYGNQIVNWDTPLTSVVYGNQWDLSSSAPSEMESFLNAARGESGRLKLSEIPINIQRLRQQVLNNLRLTHKGTSLQPIFIEEARVLLTELSRS